MPGRAQWADAFVSCGEGAGDCGGACSHKRARASCTLTPEQPSYLIMITYSTFCVSGRGVS